MQTDSIKHICSGLMYKAKTERFLDHPIGKVEKEANRFVEDFAKQNGLTAHTLSANRWYFQTDDRLLEDGFVELKCHKNFLRNHGTCFFSVVDVEEIDNVRHLKEVQI